MSRSESKLTVRWGKREKDWVIDYPSSPDGWLAHGLIRGDDTLPEFIQELKERGYDLTTLRISVERKKQK
ncbi:hypothetical protein D3C85_768240 [compost metagenome]